MSFFQSGAVELAIEQFTRATKRAPWVASDWLNLGVALLDKGELDDAQAALERSLKLNPKSQSTYFHLGQLFAKRMDEQVARTAFERCIELNPDTYLAQHARERVEDWRPRILTIDD